MDILTRHDKVKVGSERGFGFVFAAVFSIVGLWPVIGGNVPRLWALAIAALFLIVALLRPLWLRPLNVLWFRFGLLLGRIVSPVVMALIFAVAVVPTGLIMRALGKDPLRMRLDDHAESYWIERDAEPTGSMKNQF